MHPDPIETYDDVLSPEECRVWIEHAEAAGFDDAPVTLPQGIVRRPEIRNNTRMMADDHARVALIWSRVRARVPQELDGWRVVGLNERLRWYRYDPGQYFAPHRDGAFVRGPDERSLFTFMVYLNDDFDGGQTAFPGVEVTPAAGRALLFWHGLLHVGRVVTRGRKYAVRSDLMFRRAP